MPGVIHERPKISHAMWEALKSHIIREQQKKRQEQEADAEEERLRKEREKKHKEDVMTLEETKDQLASLEKRLSTLKEEKHQLFMQLKKVLNEDETRKRQQLIKEEIFVPPGYNPSHHTGHPHLMPQNFPPVPGKPPGLYKINPSPPKPPSSNILKRSRSPSPPYQQSYNYKGQPFNSHSKNLNPHSLTGSSYYPTSASSHPISSAISSNYHHSPSIYSYSGPNQYQQQVVSIPETKPITGTYITHVNSSQTRGYVGSLHQQLDQANHKSGFAASSQGQDPGKYYVVHNNPVPLRNNSHVNIPNPGIISLQQRDPKTGSITQGYPVRPNLSHSAQSTPGYPPNSIANPHNVYPSHSPSRLGQTHPHGRFY